MKTNKTGAGNEGKYRTTHLGPKSRAHVVFWAIALTLNPNLNLNLFFLYKRAGKRLRLGLRLRLRRPKENHARRLRRGGGRIRAAFMAENEKTEVNRLQGLLMEAFGLSAGVSWLACLLTLFVVV